LPDSVKPFNQISRLCTLEIYMGIHKITNIYCTLSMYTNPVSKEGVILKPEQLQAIHLIYKGRDVFGKSICYEVLPFLFDCKLGESESSAIIIVSQLVSLMVDQVASLQLHGVSAAIMGGHRYG